MKTRGLRAALAADPDVGAGNVLTSVLRHGADPQGPGLTFDTAVDGYQVEHPLTLAELERLVAARAAWLRDRGVRPRDPIVVWASSAADTVLSYLAATRLGAIPALLNGALPVEIAATFIRRLRASGVVADADRLRLLDGQQLGVPLLGDTAAMGAGDTGAGGAGDTGAAPPAYRHHADDPVVITHTSGTTGVPKAVTHSHQSLFAATRHLLSMPQAQGTRRILNALPAPHTATVLMVNQALGNRAEFLALSSQDGATVLDAIQRWRPDGVFGFSVTWAELARFDLSARQLDSVRLWFNTGDCTHEPHVRGLVAVGSHDVVNRDGVTRTPGSCFIDGLGSSEMGHSIFHITHRTDTDQYGRCIGRPYRFAEAAVLDLDGNQLPDGQVGHLGIKSPTLFRGYWNDSATTFRSRLNGYYLTGDLVYRDPDGRYFHMDRAVDAVDAGGGRQFYVAASEERVLAACPDVVDCTVVMTPGRHGVTTDVLLALAPDADPAEDHTERVRAALGPEVGATLSRVRSAAQHDIPMTVTGKVRRLALRDTYPAGAAS